MERGWQILLNSKFLNFSCTGHKEQQSLPRIRLLGAGIPAVCLLNLFSLLLQGSGQHSQRQPLHPSGIALFFDFYNNTLLFFFFLSEPLCELLIFALSSNADASQTVTLVPHLVHLWTLSLDDLRPSHSQYLLCADNSHIVVSCPNLSSEFQNLIPANCTHPNGTLNLYSSVYALSHPESSLSGKKAFSKWRS